LEEEEDKGKAGFLQRSRVDIIACILKSSNPRSRKTRLIYGCNLSLSQFNVYAECLIQAGLLTKNMANGIETYQPTKKGKAFLKDYAKIREVLEQMRV